MSKVNSQKGFTLVELLIVMAIIAVLVVLGLPQFESYRTKANNAAAHSDLKTFRTAMEASLASNLTYPVIP